MSSNKGSQKKKIIYSPEIENKHRDGREPDRRKKCPECGSKSFTTSTLYGRQREVINGKTIYNRLIRQDAGSFNCKKCGYTETY